MLRSGGINSWYLDRGGRGDGHFGDDDQPDRGPESWLDRLTATPAPSGGRPPSDGLRRGRGAGRGRASGQGRTRTTLTGLSPRSSESSGRPLGASDPAVIREATVRGWKLQETPGRQKSSPSPRSAQTDAKQPTAHDRMLVRAAKLLLKEARKELSYKQVVQGLQRAGISVTEARLRRAIRSTGTAWGGASTKARPGRRAVSPAASAKARSIAKGRPRPKIVEAVRRLRTARPDWSAGEIGHQLRASGFRVAETEVVAAIEEAQLRGRRKARPTDFDRALAREASLICARSARMLSPDEVVKRLRAAKWRVDIADLDYALLVTNTKLGAPSMPRQSIRATSGGAGGHRLQSRDDASDPTICQACGSSVSANGYCGCS